MIFLRGISWKFAGYGWLETLPSQWLPALSCELAKRMAIFSIAFLKDVTFS